MILSNFIVNINSEKGDVAHWMHHDCARKHVYGRLKHQGRTYQEGSSH
ncbi:MULTISPECIES: DUF3465 domain-containing protein [Acinetobacter]